MLIRGKAGWGGIWELNTIVRFCKSQMILNLKVYGKYMNLLKKRLIGTSLVVQWLILCVCIAQGTDLIPAHESSTCCTVQPNKEIYQLHSEKHCWAFIAGVIRVGVRGRRCTRIYPIFLWVKWESVSFGWSNTEKSFSIPVTNMWPLQCLADSGWTLFLHHRLHNLCSLMLITLVAALWLFLEPECVLHQLASFQNPEKSGRLEVRVPLSVTWLPCSSTWPFSFLTLAVNWW